MLQAADNLMVLDIAHRVIVRTHQPHQRCMARGGALVRQADRHVIGADDQDLVLAVDALLVIPGHGVQRHVDRRLHPVTEHGPGQDGFAGEHVAGLGHKPDASHPGQRQEPAAK
ncbi:hypothetical protein D3C85_1605040 [compost metagenome]